MIGNSAEMRSVKGYLTKVAATDCNVLLTGETGTGKELAARLVHQLSPRSRRPLVCINCAALPDSLLESELFGYEKGAFTGAGVRYEGRLKLAEGGTVFLDEIGDMSPFAQAKILRAIESKEVYPLGSKRGTALDVRFIAATNQELESQVSQNRFRKDLYFRLNVARIRLPPLRERKDDIPLLIDHFLRELNDRCGRIVVEGFTGEALLRLCTYGWPGNVRELHNLLEALFIDPPSRRVSLRDLPEPFREGGAENDGLSVAERELLLATLCSTRWNKTEAARELNWSRMTLYRKMAKYQIHRERPSNRRQNDLHLEKP